MPYVIFIPMENPSLKRLALALDNLNTITAIKDLIIRTAPSIGVFKVGLELYTRFGPQVCSLVREQNRKIFLDLKLHDIPNTVAMAVEAACSHNVDFLTVHTLGGMPMLRSAAAARLRAGSGHTKIIGVTLLTSIDAACLRDELLVAQGPADYARHLASLAVRAGLDGIVCSASDLLKVKPALPEGFEIVTPGIRPSGGDRHDQKRVSTPREAVLNGATLLVVGRAVTESDDPAKAAAAMAAEIS